MEWMLGMAELPHAAAEYGLNERLLSEVGRPRNGNYVGIHVQLEAHYVYYVLLHHVG